MSRNRTLDGHGGSQAKPGLQHGRGPSTIGRRVQVAPDEHQVQLISFLGPEPSHAGSSGASRGRHDP